MALIIAWRFESHRRTWQHWAADNLKQAFSAAVVHSVATGVAVELRHLVEWVDECDWYIMVFVWDTVLGCAINIIVYRATANFCKSIPSLEYLSRVGDYEAPPSPIDHTRVPSDFRQRFRRWFGQLMHWVICAIIGRLCVFALLFALHSPFGHIASLLGSWGCSNQGLQVKTWIFVVVIPVSMDATQFVVQNFWLKPKASDDDDKACMVHNDDDNCQNDHDNCEGGRGSHMLVAAVGSRSRSNSVGCRETAIASGWDDAGPDDRGNTDRVPLIGDD